jgi:hypothetical protein
MFTRLWPIGRVAWPRLCGPGGDTEAALHTALDSAPSRASSSSNPSPRLTRFELCVGFAAKRTMSSSGYYRSRPAPVLPGTFRSRPRVAVSNSRGAETLAGLGCRSVGTANRGRVPARDVGCISASRTSSKRSRSMWSWMITPVTTFPAPEVRGSCRPPRRFSPEHPAALSIQRLLAALPEGLSPSRDPDRQASEQVAQPLETQRADGEGRPRNPGPPLSACLLCWSRSSRAPRTHHPRARFARRRPSRASGCP